MGGTADGTATGTVQNRKVDSHGSGAASIFDTGGTALFTSGNPGYVTGVGVGNGDALASQTGTITAFQVPASPPSGLTTGHLYFGYITPYGSLYTDNTTIGGVPTLTGNGATGTGSPRVTIASDNSAIAGMGVSATGTTAPANSVYSGGRATSADPTAATDGQNIARMLSLTGKTITLPYAVKELQFRGSSGAQTDGSAHTIIAAAAGSLKNYITDWECSNTSATTVRVTFSDDASTTVIVPAGSGNNKSLHIPLATAAATAFTMTASTGVSSIYCSAQGYTGL